MRPRPRLAAFLLPAGCVLAGCLAETVRQNPPRHGPVREIGFVDQGGGEVRYSSDGWGWMVAGRRYDAMRRMRHICGKLKAVVTDEFEHEDADVPYSQEDIAVTMSRGIEHFIVAPYTHLVFECAPLPAGKEKAPAASVAHSTAPLVEPWAAGVSTAAAPPPAISSGPAPVNIPTPEAKP